MFWPSLLCYPRGIISAAAGSVENLEYKNRRHESRASFPQILLFQITFELNHCCINGEKYLTKYEHLWHLQDRSHRHLNSIESSIIISLHRFRRSHSSWIRGTLSSRRPLPSSPFCSVTGSGHFVGRVSQFISQFGLIIEVNNVRVRI